MDGCKTKIIVKNEKLVLFSAILNLVFDFVLFESVWVFCNSVLSFGL